MCQSCFFCREYANDIHGEPCVYDWKTKTPNRSQSSCSCSGCDWQSGYFITIPASQEMAMGYKSSSYQCRWRTAWVVQHPLHDHEKETKRRFPLFVQQNGNDQPDDGSRNGFGFARTWSLWKRTLFSVHHSVYHLSFTDKRFFRQRVSIRKWIS